MATVHLYFLTPTPPQRVGQLQWEERRGLWSTLHKNRLPMAARAWGLWRSGTVSKALLPVSVCPILKTQCGPLGRMGTGDSHN